MAKQHKKIEELNKIKEELEKTLQFMTPSQKLEVALDAAAKHREWKLQFDLGTRTELGRSDDVGAKMVGLSKSYLAQIKTVVDHAREQPLKFGEIKDEMDRTGDFRSAYVKLRRMLGYKNRPVKLKESTKSGWIVFGQGRVNIVNQKVGSKPTGEVSFSTREFDKLAKWYLRERKNKKS